MTILRHTASIVLVLFWMNVLVGCGKSVTPAPIEVYPVKIRPRPPLQGRAASGVARNKMGATSQAPAPLAAMPQNRRGGVTIQSLDPLPLVGGPESPANDTSSTATDVALHGRQAHNTTPFVELPEDDSSLVDTPSDETSPSVPSSNRLTNPHAFLQDQSSSSSNLPSASATSAHASAQQRTPTPTTRLHAPDFNWPVVGRILSRFGGKDAAHFNDGINIATRKGMPVRAAADGIISYVGDKITTFGTMVVVKHAEGWSSTYAHLGKALVKRDQRVRRGQIIAHAGASGDVQEPQLHFEIRHHGEPVPPFDYLGP